MTTFRFADGSARDLTPTDGLTVLGLDADGYVVVRLTELARQRNQPFVMDYALTACCQASAKGCDGYIGCRACYAEVDPKLGGPPDPIVHPVLPDPPKETRMSRTAQPKPADQFRALGLTDETEWTPGMRLAVKQKWSGLPIDAKVDDLRAQLAAVQVEPVPAVDDLTKLIGDRDMAVAEHARLTRNAKVNAWRERGRLRAALEARELKFARLRAARGKTAAVATVAAVAAAVADAVPADDGADANALAEAMSS